MTPLEPIRETVEAADEMEPLGDHDDLLAALSQLANRARRIVPDLVGVSIARLEEGITFTLVATAQEIAVLDAVQYVAGGPCVEAAHSFDVREFNDDDVLGERRWQLFAEATAAHAVRSTLTLPVLSADRVIGTVNLYAASRRAFAGHHADLADIFGAWAPGAVENADLSFMTVLEAKAAPQRLRDQVMIDSATGILAAELDLDVDAAQEHLRDAAVRAGVSELDLARNIVRARERPRDDDYN